MADMGNPANSTSKEGEDEVRIAHLKEQYLELKERMIYVEKQSGEMVKIALILDLQKQMNEKQNETLEKINDNLSTLNNNTNKLTERVDDLETEVKEQSRRGTLVISDAVKKYVGGGLLVAVGILVTWIMGLLGVF